MPLSSGTWSWDEWVARGFPRMICDHVWETLEDGTILCFECDQIKKPTSQ
jgi:hypothetical protein